MYAVRTYVLFVSFCGGLNKSLFPLCCIFFTVPRKYGFPVVFVVLFCLGLPSALDLNILVNQVRSLFTSCFVAHVEFLYKKNVNTYISQTQESIKLRD